MSSPDTYINHVITGFNVVITLIQQIAHRFTMFPISKMTLPTKQEIPGGCGAKVI